MTRRNINACKNSSCTYSLSGVGLIFPHISNYNVARRRNISIKGTQKYRISRYLKRYLRIELKSAKNIVKNLLIISKNVYKPYWEIHHSFSFFQPLRYLELKIRFSCTAFQLYQTIEGNNSSRRIVYGYTLKLPDFTDVCSCLRGMADKTSHRWASVFRQPTKFTYDNKIIFKNLTQDDGLFSLTFVRWPNTVASKNKAFWFLEFRHKIIKYMEGQLQCLNIIVLLRESSVKDLNENINSIFFHPLINDWKELPPRTDRGKNISKPIKPGQLNCVKSFMHKWI